MTQTAPTRPRGRPRAFDEDRVLDQLIDLFSAAGFSASGISQLSEVSGLTAGSLYKAYQDKEGIFAKALGRYIARREAEVAAIVSSAENSRAAMAGLLQLYVRLSQGEAGKLGCLWVSGMNELLHFVHADAALRDQLAQRRVMLARLVQRGHADGSITTTSEPAVVAEMLIALLSGMRVLGKSGSFTQQGDAFVALALKLLD